MSKFKAVIGYTELKPLVAIDKISNYKTFHKSCLWQIQKAKNSFEIEVQDQVQIGMSYYETVDTWNIYTLSHGKSRY